MSLSTILVLWMVPNRCRMQRSWFSCIRKFFRLSRRMCRHCSYYCYNNNIFSRSLEYEILCWWRKYSSGRFQNFLRIFTKFVFGWLSASHCMHTIWNHSKHVMKREQLSFTRKGENAVVMRAKVPKVSGRVSLRLNLVGQDYCQSGILGTKLVNWSKTFPRESSLYDVHRMESEAMWRRIYACSGR